MDAVTTWQGLVHEFRGRLGFNQRASSVTITTSEDEYRATLTRLCANYGERDVERQLNRFRRQHVPIITFVRTIDTANQHTEREYALEPLIWQLMTCAAEAAFVARKRLRDIIKTTHKLNDDIPAVFAPEQLSKFPHERTVQKPLLEFFKEYMDCYLSMFSEFATYPRVLSLDQYENHVQNAKDCFAPRAQAWELALTAVEEERLRMLRTNSTVDSHNYGSPGWHASHQSAQFRVRYVDHLGSGTYGEVSKVQEVTTKIYYAQKLVQPRGRRDAAAMAIIEKQVKSEVEIMQKLRHDHIASIVFCGLEGNAFRLLMQPVADCDLQVFLDNCVNQGYPKESLRLLDNWFGCLISALAYAHDKSIKHEDIKPKNILIKGSSPFLSDFGSAKDFSEIDAGSISPDQIVVGTLAYLCPESTRRGRKADIFSMGCVFAEMLTVRQRKSLEEFRSARHADGSGVPSAFRGNLAAVHNWLKSLPGVEEKYTVQALLLEVIQQMLEENPEERLDARAVKRRFRGEGERLFCHTCS